MATVNKNFRIKNGLVVEGSTATVNGQNVLTEVGSDQYILDLVGGSGTSANTPNTLILRDGSGNFAAGTITVNQINIGEVGNIHDDGDIVISNTNGQDVILEGEDIRLNAQDDVRINAGTGGDVVLDATTGNIRFQGPNIFAGENISYTDAERVATRGYVDDAASSAQTNANSYTDGELANYTPTNNLDSTIDGYGYLKSADLTGYATESYVDTAETDAVASANSYTDTREIAITNAYESYADNAASTAANNAQSAAESHADNLIADLGGSGTASVNGHIDILTGTGIDVNPGNNSIEIARQTVDTWYDAYGSASQALADANTYTDTAVGNLVGAAPELLNTLEELATALENNPDIIADLENVAAGKQNTLTPGANIDITNDTISVTGLDTDDVAEGTNLYFTDARARDAVDGTDRSFTSVAINEVSKEVAATTGNIATAAATTAYSWLKTDYRSAKFMVKIKNGTHTEVSEILVTLDTSDNVYVTEYGMSSTSGTSLGTISADVSSNDVRIRVTPANDNSEVIVAGTLLI